MLLKITPMGLALAILANPCAAQERVSLSPVEGTLVAVVPTRDGVVLAADSRSVLSDVACDGIEKIVVPRHDMRAAVVFAGLAQVALTSDGFAQSCEDAHSARPGLDFRKVIQDYLDAVRDTTALDLRKLAQLCIDEAQSFQALSLTLKRPFLEGRRDTMLLIFAITSFDPASKSSRVGIAALTVGSDDTISSTVVSDQVFSRSSPGPLLLFGKATLVEEQVFRGTGSQYLDWEKVDAISERKVGDLWPAAVMAALRSIFDAAARVAAETMATPSIGGAVQIVLVGDAPRPRRISPGSNPAPDTVRK